ncbi:TMC2 protein, partial [Polypterus senegalus]|nr:TMC2 protein [Polypterus senegalus]
MDSEEDEDEDEEEEEEKAPRQRRANRKKVAKYEDSEEDSEDDQPKKKANKKGNNKAEKEEQNTKAKQSDKNGKGKNKNKDDGGEKKKKKKNDSSSSASDSNSSDEESLSEGEMAKLMEEVEEKKKLISNMRNKPWRMKRRLHALREAQAFVEKFEGALGKGKGRKFYAYKVMMTKILMGLPYGSIARKTVPRDEQDTAMDFSTLWDFNVSRSTRCKYNCGDYF